MGGGQEAAASRGPGASPGRAQRGLTVREDAEPLISQIEKPGPQSQQKKTKQGQREGAGEDGEDSRQPIPAPKQRVERGDLFRSPAKEALQEKETRKNLESRYPFPPQKSKPRQDPKMSSRS